MKIAVIGLGKIGLPLAAQFASKGHIVIGVDVNSDTVATVNAGREPFPGEHRLAHHLAQFVPSGALRATEVYEEAIPEADAVVVVVPLFVDDEGKPEFEWMDSATKDIGAWLTADTLVIYETTLPVGTTRQRWRPALEQGSGLREGVDFHLVFSPERVLTGRIFEDLRKYPKLVGALNPEGAEAATAFYESVLDFDVRLDLEKGNGVWNLGSAEAAEMAKLAETTYRDVNIGLANQFAMFADRAGIDVFQVIEACNSQPYSNIHHPGIAVGGHCIPVYPQLYLSRDPSATVVEAARKANLAMPAYAVKLLADRFESLTGKRVGVLGASYRGGVKEAAFSGVFAVAERLRELGATTLVHDPLFNDAELRDLHLTPMSLGTHLDAAIIQTAHAEYQRLRPEDLPGAGLIVDGRNILDRANWPGVEIVTVGRARTLHS